METKAEKYKKWLKSMSRPKDLEKIQKEKLEKKKKIAMMKPSSIFHDFATIQWLRKRLDNSVIRKSVFSLLPDNGKPVIPEDESEEDKKKRELKEYLQNYCKNNDKHKNMEINPKYLFNEKTFDKVKKLKKIFIDFDEDGSRSMEVNEMCKLFNDNGINASIDELIYLFFEKKNVTEKEADALFLDFYQFMEFALTKDQNFRYFMRGIKERLKKANQEKSTKDINQNNKDTLSDTNIQEEKVENESKYLPMNFNLILDYFLQKGAEREAHEKIDLGIKLMDLEIEKNCKGEHYLKENDLKLSYSDDEKNEGTVKDTRKNRKLTKLKTMKNPNRNIEKEEEELLEKIPSDDEEEQEEEENNNDLDEKEKEKRKKEKEEKKKRRFLNFSKLMENFIPLFSVNTEKNLSSKISKGVSRRRGTINRTPKIVLPTKNISNINNECNKYTNMVYDHINKEYIIKSALDNYDKFHSLYLAINHTKSELYKDDPYKKSKTYYQQPKKNVGNLTARNKFNATCKLPFINKNNISNISNINTSTFYITHKNCKNDYVPIELLK